MKHKVIFDGTDLQELVAAKLHLQNLETQTVVFRDAQGEEVSSDLVSVEVEAQPYAERQTGCKLCNGTPPSTREASPPEPLSMELDGPLPVPEIRGSEEELNEELGESLDPPEYDGAAPPPGMAAGSPQATVAAGRRLAQTRDAPFSRAKLTGGIGGESTKPPWGGK